MKKQSLGYCTQVCWRCGRNGQTDPLDRHHIFGGSLRKKSERYGLVVSLCHHDCHIFGENSVHRNQAERDRLKAWGQRKAMAENGWNRAQFILEFGKNYLDREDEKVQEEAGNFHLTEEQDEFPEWF